MTQTSLNEQEYVNDLEKLSTEDLIGETLFHIRAMTSRIRKLEKDVDAGTELAQRASRSAAKLAKLKALAEQRGDFSILYRGDVVIPADEILDIILDEE